MNEIVLGLDVSTTTIGCAIILNDNSDYGKIIELTHIAPKVKKCQNKNEELFIKKEIFSREFLEKWKNFGITKVIIEEPLLRSNNVNTVGTLLRFNGMISDAVYCILGIVPEYISSYDARKYSFPELMAIRKYDKKGVIYPFKKILNSVKKNNLTLFGNYQWDIDKKTVIQGKVADIFTNINWLYNKKGELKKENFDACDAYVACLGFINKEKYGELDFKINNIVTSENKNIEYNISYWDKNEQRIIYC